MKFSNFKLDERLIHSLVENEFTIATQIQIKAIPKALKRNDVLGIAPTGTGKTFAYVLPSLHWLFNAKIPHNDPSVLILVPTRELVKQVQQTILLFSKHTEIFTVAIFAGQKVGKQKRALENVLDIIIATPGRLMSFLEDNSVSLKNISVLVMDEADRLLDMGFLPDIKIILSYLPHKNKRQTMMFGATLPSKVEKFARHLQKRTVLIDLGRSQLPRKIVHEVFEVETPHKFDILLDLLHKSEIYKVLIFTVSKEAARITARNLLKNGLEIEELHGGLTQRTRNIALSNFKSGEVKAMVATDIAARGIDIIDLSHVVSFDVPKSFDDYLHRAGRTGRIGQKGVSWILAAPEEFKFLQNIEDGLGYSIKRKIKIKLVKPTGIRPTGIKPNTSPRTDKRRFYKTYKASHKTKFDKKKKRKR